MRRFAAVLAVLAWLLGAAPAGACRPRATKACCCEQPAPASVCPVRCCKSKPPQATRSTASPAMSSLSAIAPASSVPFVAVAARPTPAPPSGAWLSLHERASPRLPLRI